MAKEVAYMTDSLDCIPIAEQNEALLRFQYGRDIELLLSDGMVDEIGRVLEDYPFGNPLSVCPSPHRTESPYPYTAPMLVSSSSGSTLFSSFDRHELAAEKSKGTKKRKRSPLADGNGSAASTDSDASSDQATDMDTQISKRPNFEALPPSIDAVRPINTEAQRAPKKKNKKKDVDPNAAISERSRKSSSTYRGVSLCTKDSRWQARIRIKKEVVYLGRFETEEAAARRYDEAAREHHGDKALINFITPEDRALGRRSVFEQAGGKSARV